VKRTFRWLYRYLREEELADKWTTGLNALFGAGVIVSALDVAILQHGRYALTLVGVAGVVLFVVGLSIYGVSRRALGRFFSTAVRVLPDHRLITSGPYRLIRHPIYLGGILYSLAIPMIANSLYGFVVMLIMIPVLIYRIRIEEQVLLSKFGSEYTVYAHKTKKLVPYIY